MAAVRKSCLFALMLAMLNACGAGWHRLSPLEPVVLSPRQQVQVWQHGTQYRWHAVVITTDSVQGILYLQPITCDSCRRSLPRPEVDSLRLGNPVAGFWKGVGLVAGTVLVAGLIVCWNGCALEN